MSHICPLCEAESASLFHQDQTKRSQREYYRCSDCYLVFVPSSFFLPPELEKAEYDLHENALEDAGYGRFLNRFWQPLSSKLKEQSSILEFGCGPGPLLAKMMTAEGHEVSLYDHFYYPDKEVLKPRSYDVVTATEVFEHLHQPKQVLESCLSWVKPEGWLAIMTKLVTDQAAFAYWHYKNDMTHVIFFSEETFAWIAKQYGLTAVFADKDVILLRKP